MKMEELRIKRKFKAKRFIEQLVVRGLVFLFILLILLPIWFVFTTSLTTEVAYLRDGVSFIPKEFTFQAYEMVFEKPLFLRSIGNSLFVTIVGSVLSLIVTALMAYPLSKPFLPGRRWIMFVTYMSGLFNGGVIPTWLVVKWTGLYDSLWALIIALMIMPWLIVLLRNFFLSVPREIEEAGMIDGCGVIQAFIRIVIPMSLPALATTIMYYSLFRWNEWFYALVFIQNRELWPLQVYLRDVLLMGSVSGGGTGQDTSQGVPNETYKMAMVVVSMIPLLVMYPFVQKFFVKGLTMGGVKG